MIGLILITHGDIGAEMLKAVEHVVGPQSLARSFSVMADDDVDVVLAELKEMIQKCDAGNGVLLLADMFGGTPCNLALACTGMPGVEVLSGFNLPMLIKAATLRQEITEPRQLAEKAREAGRYHMHFASELLSGNKRG